MLDDSRRGWNSSIKNSWQRQLFSKGTRERAVKILSENLYRQVIIAMWLCTAYDKSFIWQSKSKYILIAKAVNNASQIFFLYCSYEDVIVPLIRLLLVTEKLFQWVTLVHMGSARCRKCYTVPSYSVKNSYLKKISSKSLNCMPRRSRLSHLDTLIEDGSLF